MTFRDSEAQGWRNLVRLFLLPICKLNRIQFEAPWRPRRKGC